MKICIPSYNRAGKVHAFDVFDECYIVIPKSQEQVSGDSILIPIQ